MSILVATEGASQGNSAVECGMALGKRLECRVVILSVFNKPPDHHERERFADAVSRWADASGYPASAYVATGEEADEILRKARDQAADAIVLGPHRSSLLDDLFGQSMVEAIVADTDRKLIVAGGEKHAFERILTLVDCSQPSAKAAIAAHRLFPRASMHFVRPWHVPYEGFLRSEQSHQDYEVMVANQTREFLDQLGITDSDGSLLAGEVLIREGETISVVKECLAEVGADLLVIGVEGRAGLLSSALDPTARHLLEDPPCDVLAVQSGSRI